MLDSRKTVHGLGIAVLAGCMWFLANSGRADARIYRYVDPGGVVHYTDNALEVPAALRPPLIETALSVEKTAAKTPAAASADNHAVQAVRAKKEALKDQKARMDTRLEQLKRGKAKLDAEFESLQREQQQLEKERVVKHSKRVYRIYNQKVKELDARIKDYNARRAAFNKQVEAYNARMRQFDEKRKALNAEIQAFNQQSPAAN